MHYIICAGGGLEVVAISANTSVDAGGTAVLICVGYGQPNVDITWSRDGQIISNSSLVSIYEEDLAQGGRVFKQSFLQICSVGVAGSDIYTCTVSNGRDSVNSTVELSVTGEMTQLVRIGVTSEPTFNRSHI